MEEARELAALTMRALHTYCLGVSTALILAACQSPDASVQTFDASSDVKFQQSLIRLEAQLNADEKLALSKAIGRLESYPQDGNCAVTNLLAHAKKSADPAFRQKLRLTRLHGLTAQQVLDVAEEKNCDAELDANPAEPIPAANVDSPEIASEQKGRAAITLNPRSVMLEAQYMLADFTPRYAALRLSCYGSDIISISTQDNHAPMQKTASGTLVNQIGEANMRPPRHFWERYSVLIDDVPVTLPPKYLTITKTVQTETGHFESRSERVVTGTDEVVSEILWSKLKIAKAMRLQNHAGIGPTFDLTTIKNDLETLEAQCASQEAN